MINQVILQGRLTRDCELRKTANGMAVASFTIASDDSYRKGPNGEKTTVFMNCSMFGNRAENLAKFTRKGSLIAVIGRLTQRSYVNKQNVNVTVTEIVVDNFELLEPKANGNAATGYQPDSSAPSVTSQVPVDSGNLDSMDVVDDDLPF